MEMRVKHLEKMGEVAKAVVLAKACTECSVISNQATFRQTFVSLLCHLLPNEEAIMEVLQHKGRNTCTRVPLTDMSLKHLIILLSNLTAAI